MLVRHGQANDFAEGDQDFLRDLSSKGKKDIMKLGQKLPLWLDHEFLLMTSPANRTYQTSKIILENFDKDAEPFIIEDLYLADPNCLLEILNDIPDEFQSVLLIGHNPGLSQLIDYLCGTHNTSLKTGACAIINCEIDTWKHLSADLGQLQMTLHI